MIFPGTANGKAAYRRRKAATIYKTRSTERAICFGTTKPVKVGDDDHIVPFVVIIRIATAPGGLSMRGGGKGVWGGPSGGRSLQGAWRGKRKARCRGPDDTGFFLREVRK